jgi:tRNA threonylcarbamoyladenosine biosynthesis protein TsaE
MDAIFELVQIKSVANAIWKEGKKFPVWAFYASMGSGKTTFIHALCEILGVKSAVSSPTFALINEYHSDTNGTIQHMDWYRIKNATEAIDAGIEEILLSGDTCLVEWPENALSILPDNTFHLKIEVLSENTRRIFSFDPNAAE